MFPGRDIRNNYQNVSKLSVVGRYVLMDINIGAAY